MVVARSSDGFDALAVRALDGTVTRAGHPVHDDPVGARRRARDRRLRRRVADLRAGRLPHRRRRDRGDAAGPARPRARPRDDLGARADDVHLDRRRRRPAGRPRALLPAGHGPRRPRRRAPAAARRPARRPDRVGGAGAQPRGPVLDEPGLRGRRRGLRRLQRLRPRLPRAAPGRLGRRRRRRLPRRGGRARRRRSGRPEASRHPRWVRGRLHDARRAGPRRHPLRRGCRPLRGRRPRGPRPRDAQVRVALPRRSDRPVPGGARRLRGALADHARRAVHDAR